MLPTEFNRMKIPAVQNFQDEELSEIRHQFIYPKDAVLLLILCKIAAKNEIITR
jgi:hypothetical protein